MCAIASVGLLAVASTASSHGTLDRPKITWFGPASAPVGGEVILGGTNMAKVTSVTLDGVDVGKLRHPDYLHIRIHVPSGPLRGAFQATNAAGTSDPKGTFAVTPTVTGYDPPGGAGRGSPVTLLGTALTGASVKFNGRSATVDGSDYTSIHTHVPSNATAGAVTVRTANGTGKGPSFSLKPVITGLSAPAKPLGPLTITGITLEGATSVTVHGIAVDHFTQVSPSRIDTTVPFAAISGRVTVTTPNGTATSLHSFTVLPELIYFFPWDGLVGQNLYIVGRAFHNIQKVTIHGQPIPYTSEDGGQTLTLKIPGNVRSGPVKVYVPEGILTGSPDFTRDEPAPLSITSVEPSAAAKGATLLIRGHNFSKLTSVSVGGVNIPGFDVASETRLFVTVPDVQTATIVLHDNVTSVQSNAFQILFGPKAAMHVAYRATCNPTPCGIREMNGDGTGDTSLTTDAADHDPAWSPDGTRIAFERSSAIWVMNADGTGPAQLAAGEHPTWSPDGSTVAFTRGGAIWKMDANGSNQALVVSPAGDAGTEYADPAWSPDGTRIAFGFTVFSGADETQGIATVKTDGTGPTTLLSYTDNELIGIRGLENPEYSPDGSQLAFDETAFDGGHYVLTISSTVPVADRFDVPWIKNDVTDPSWTHCTRIVTDGLNVMFPDATGFTALGPGSEPSCWES